MVIALTKWGIHSTSLQLVEELSGCDITLAGWGDCNLQLTDRLEVLGYLTNPQPLPASGWDVGCFSIQCHRIWRHIHNWTVAQWSSRAFPLPGGCRSFASMPTPEKKWSHGKITLHSRSAAWTIPIPISCPKIQTDLSSGALAVLLQLLSSNVTVSSTTSPQDFVAPGSGWKSARKRMASPPWWTPASRGQRRCTRQLCNVANIKSSFWTCFGYLRQG